jgi:hypothetical protein
MTGALYYIQLFSIDMGISQLFLPRLAWNYDPLDLNLPVAWGDR